MCKRINRFIFHTWNFTGVFSLKYLDDKTVVLSDKLAVLNLLKTSLALTFSILLTVFPFLRDDTFSSEVLELEQYSTFSKVIVFVIVYMEQCTAIVLCLVNFHRRHEICCFLNRFLKFHLSSKTLEKFKKSYFKNFCFLSFIIISICFFQFLAAMSFTAGSFFFFLFFMYPYLAITSFLTFMQFFEVFFLILMKDLKLDLKIGTQETDLLLVKHQSIYQIVEEFNNCFGVQMTTVTSYFVVTTVLQVMLNNGN